MNKIFLALMFAASLTGCMKDAQENNPNQTILIYELESYTATSFMEIKYGSGLAGPNKNWDTSGIGTFQKIDTIKKGIGVFFEVRHASSNKWKIRIKTADGSLLIEGPVKFSAGTPGYYYSSIGATVN